MVERLFISDCVKGGCGWQRRTNGLWVVSKGGSDFLIIITVGRSLGRTEGFRTMIMMICF